MKIRLFYSFFLLLAGWQCMSCRQGISEFSIVKEDSLQYEGRAVELFRMTNRKGMTVKVTNYGASLAFVSAPDRNGVYEPVVLGLDSLPYYLGRQPKLGATVGRFANRIRNAEFCIGDAVYPLEKNNKVHSIHGGRNGFHTRIFETDTSYVVKDTAVVVFKYLSRDAEGGFPGNLTLSLAYKLTDDNEVILDYRAVTDKPTVLNLTNHSYFNLTGCKGPVLDHRYRIEGDSITPVDSAGIPTGKVMAVAGTEYDFRTFQSARQRIERRRRGYDINYKLNKGADTLALAAEVVEPVSGRVLKAYTTEPGMQFYIPATDLNYLRAYAHHSYGRYYGFCLEMQHFPDSPHHPHFPTTLLLPGETYRQMTIYKFGTLSTTK